MAAAAEMDASYLFSMLESNESEKANEIKNKLHETLSANPKDNWLVIGLVEYYFNTHSTRCFEILTELREPHDKHLFDKLAECTKNAITRVNALMLFGHIICKQPSWLFKVANHSLLTILLKILKNDNEVVALLIGLLDLINLLPIIPSIVSPNLMTIFEIFSRLAAWNTTKAANIPEVSVLHFHVGVYSLFHRLYGMYPCNFLSYLRSHYGNRENLEIFAKTIRPMLDRVRMHPLLVTASKDSELSTTRWRQMETHAVVMECAKVSLDIVEGISNEILAYSYAQQVNLNSEKAADSATVTLSGACSYISSERQGLVTAKKLESASLWSSCKDESASDTLEVKELNTPNASYLTSPRASATKVDLVSSFSESQPSSPLRIIGSPVKFLQFNDDTSVKKDWQKQSVARALQFYDSSVEETSAPGKIFHTKSTDSDSEVDKEVYELVGRMKTGTSILEDSGKEDERHTLLCQRSDSVIHDEAEGIQTEDYEECTSSSLIEVVEFVRKVRGRMRYFSQCGQAPEPSELKPKVKPHRSHSCPNLAESPQNTNETVEVSNIDIGDSKNINLVQQSAVAQDEDKVVSEEDQIADDKSETEENLSNNVLILRALPMMAPTCCFRCQNCLDQGAVFKEMSPAELLDRHVYFGSEVHLKELSAFSNRTPSSTEDTSIAKSQILLLYNQLLFERHRRGLHSERNRCLLAKLKKAQVTEEQHVAVREQLKRKEADFVDINEKYHGLTKQKIIEVVEKVQHAEALASENRLLKIEMESVKFENETMKKMISSGDQRNKESLKELQSCQAKLRTATIELQDLKIKLAENTKVQTELERVKKEHLLLGELQQKYREKVSSLSNQSNRKLQTSHLIESCKTDVNTMRHQLDQRIQQTEFMKARLADLESQLSKKEIIINEQKNLFHKVKEENEAKVKLLEDRNRETVHIISRLVSYIRLLSSHPALENSDLLRQLPNVIEPLSLQSSRSRLDTSTELLPTSRRSSGGSDVLDSDTADSVKKH